MAAGIQHVQATQLIKISSPSTGGMAALKDIKISSIEDSELRMALAISSLLHGISLI
jgi:hypothetical protein